MKSRRFTQDDQLRFAALSGDCNPMHVNPVQARRTMFGRQVVHGIHLLMWALEQQLPADRSVVKLRVTFRNPVGVGEVVTCEVLRDAPPYLEIRLVSRGTECTVIRVEYGPPLLALPVHSSLPPQGQVRDLEPAAMAGMSGEMDLHCDGVAYASLFGAAPHKLMPQQAALLLGSTRVVGMECPGAHSIYTELSLNFMQPGGQAHAVLAWQASPVDQRFGRLTIKLASPAGSGNAVAFARPRPQQQPSYAQIKARVQPQCFAGQHALIIGGSRGIGEVCAKVLAAGGARVVLSYHLGREDGEAVAKDIVDGGGIARAIAFDVRQPPDMSAVFGDDMPTHLYYFATPPINVGSKQSYSHDIFDQFYAVYVRGLHQSYAALRKATSAPLNLMYPSSVMVDSMPDNLGEYAAAKATGEAFCRYLAAIDPALNVHIERLPRLRTDQSASLTNQTDGDTVATLLNCLPR